MMCGGNSQVTYFKSVGGTCDTSWNYECSSCKAIGITNKNTCGEAARSLGYGNQYTTASEESSDRPPGCTWNSYFDKLVYNTKKNPDPYAASTCSSTQTCFCLSAPQCTGDSKIVGCICGDQVCSVAGSYCDTSSSTCNTIPFCGEKIDQRLAQYGILYCQCGSTKCSSNEEFCDKSISSCFNVSPCSITNGITPNRADCKCGNKACTTSTGLICDIKNNTDTGSCSVGGDCGGDYISDLANITQQNCKTFNSRCQCSKCKTGFFTKDCSQTCPAPAVAVVVDFTFVILAVWTTIAYLYFHNAEIEQTDSLKETEEAANDLRGDANDITEQGLAIIEEGGSTAAGATAGALMAKQANAARVKAKLFSQKFTQKIKSLQRIIVARMQVLTAILASIMWKPEVPKFVLDSLKRIGGFFTFNVPGLLSSPDCVFGAGEGEGAAMTTINKWYISLFVPFGVMLLVAIPTFYYHKRHKADQNNKDYARMADGWNNVCTQLSFVWIFATVVTTSLSILDCDKGGRLIMDPDVMCPLSVYFQNKTFHVYKKDAGLEGERDPRPAIVGIVMLAIYCLFIGAFLRTAVKIAWTSVEDRLKKVDRIYELEERASRRKKSKNERDNRMEDIEKMDEIDDPDDTDAAIRAAAAEQVKQLKFNIPEGAVPGTTLQVPHPDGKGCNCGLNDCFRCNIKPLQYEVKGNDTPGVAVTIQYVQSAKAYMVTLKREQRKDDRQEAKDQIEMDQVNESTDEIEDSDTWKSVGWLMEDYK